MSSIAILGYGKMGKRIEELAIQRKHNVVLCTNDTPKDIPSTVEVIINFSTPDSAFDLISLGLSKGVPVVCGTTGWLDRLSEAEVLAQEHQTAFLYSSNFSLGVHLFFELNQKLAALMAKHDQYAVSIKETHHIQKLDAPSGTAITLAEAHITSRKFKGYSDEPKSGFLPINSTREGQVPGTHVVHYTSAIDQISLTHQAFNRDGFALGALIAAEWIIGKKGIFSLSDVLNLNA
ncbi:MAG: 4-hydroxy-tetrahydrodipicolinate reductase [Flavobacteriaceae bacterium]